MLDKKKRPRCSIPFMELELASVVRYTHYSLSQSVEQ